jgi:hypothetical protein
MADLKKWLSSLLSELHAESLKPLGYRKEARTISRDCGPYWERFNFQGSSWNDATSGRFYINVGIEFKDLAPRERWSYMPHTHWADRLETVVVSAPSQWVYDGHTDRPNTKAQLREHLIAAGPVLQGRASQLREEYLAKLEKRGRP